MEIWVGDAGASVGLMMLGLLTKVKFEKQLVCWRSQFTRILMLKR
jgi:hypothetical protein